MAKLTLSVKAAVVSRAKRYARQRGVSVSSLVETYLDTTSRPSQNVETPEVLRNLRGSLKKADPQDHKRYLARKYR
jgi:hypothetical protein